VRVFGNRLPREIFGPKLFGVTREWRSLMICNGKQYHSGEQIEKEMGVTFSTYGGEERNIQGFDGVTCWKETKIPRFLGLLDT